MRSAKDFIFEEDYVKPRGVSEASEQPIKNVMEKFFESLGIAADFNQEEIIKTWEELTGEFIKKLTKKIYVEDKVLYVHVNSPALKSELMMLRTSVCDRINERMGENTLKFIYIK
ncbi:MAG: DUF721 domain-containing protein [Bacteroidales bacterium]|nr:DUF721 domain-containing protein [Bacteroidales bacterium]